LKNEILFELRAKTGGGEKEMKAWKKGAIVGGVWGLVSAVGFLLQLSKPISQISKTYDILFLPGSLAARTILGPAVGLIIAYPIVSILIGVLIGAFLGYLYGLFKKREDK